jgi:hypothetical protein
MIKSSLNVSGVTKIGSARSGNVADEFTVFDVQGNIVLKKIIYLVVQIMVILYI